MYVRDERTDEERQYGYPYLVIGSDPMMGRWAAECGIVAHGESSWAAWATTARDVARVEAWVRARNDVQRVRVVPAKGYRPHGKGHLHIYVVREGHPALR